MNSPTPADNVIWIFDWILVKHLLYYNQILVKQPTVYVIEFKSKYIKIINSENTVTYEWQSMEKE